MKEIGIGLIGFGTVGAGVVECLRQNGGLVAERSGVRLALRRIADLDITSSRGVKVPRRILTTDAMSVIRDPAVDIVVELVGGTGAARRFVMEAIRAGKPVVTANKALLAEHGGEIFLAADRKGVDVCFEASVAGGIPIIRALSRGLVAENILSIHGILNGTCNYILTRMSKEGMAFEPALKEAQAAGFAEADPGLDIDGHDTAHKAAILAMLAYGFHVPLGRMKIEGIRGISRDDILYARELGYAVKLLAVIRRSAGEVEVHVNPALVKTDHMLASVNGVFNAILVKGDITGETLYYGRGAGRRPTAGAVIGDIADLARKIASGSSDRISPFTRSIRRGTIRDARNIELRYYLRMSLPDKPGIMGRVCTILGKHGVSIASVMQKEENAGNRVPVIFVTHRAPEGRYRAALAEINRLRIAGNPAVCLRIEDFE